MNNKEIPLWWKTFTSLKIQQQSKIIKSAEEIKEMIATLALYNNEIIFFNNQLYIKGSTLNYIYENCAEIYIQYQNDASKFNPKAEFPEEVATKDFEPDTYFRLFYFCQYPFKVVIGLRLGD